MSFKKFLLCFIILGLLSGCKGETLSSDEKAEDGYITLSGYDPPWELSFRDEDAPVNPEALPSHEYDAETLVNAFPKAYRSGSEWNITYEDEDDVLYKSLIEYDSENHIKHEQTIVDYSGREAMEDIWYKDGMVYYHNLEDMTKKYMDIKEDLDRAWAYMADNGINPVAFADCYTIDGDRLELFYKMKDDTHSYLQAVSDMFTVNVDTVSYMGTKSVYDKEYDAYKVVEKQAGNQEFDVYFLWLMNRDFGFVEYIQEYRDYHDGAGFKLCGKEDVHIEATESLSLPEWTESAKEFNT